MLLCCLCFFFHLEVTCQLSIYTRRLHFGFDNCLESSLHGLHPHNVRRTHERPSVET